MPFAYSNDPPKLWNMDHVSEQPAKQDVTAILTQARLGDSAANETLIQTLHGELHRIASGLLQSERAGHTLQPTALVNEAYVRLVGATPVEFENRAHFFGTAARCMRQILIKYAQARRAVKRGGDGHRVTLTDSAQPDKTAEVDLLALDDALGKLQVLDSRQCRVVELRYFAGMSVEQAAVVLGVSARTVELDWQMARAWLYRELDR